MAEGIKGPTTVNALVTVIGTTVTQEVIFEITKPVLESIVFENLGTIQENGGVVTGVTLSVKAVPEGAVVGEVLYEVIAVSEGVTDAQITNGNYLTAKTVVQGSTITVKATVVGTSITAEKVFTVDGQM